jgi:hypothetical protein
MKSEHTLSIRAFPYEVNQALKKLAIDRRMSFRALIIHALTELAQSTAAANAARGMK